jgi:hypothetical protein
MVLFADWAANFCEGIRTLEKMFFTDLNWVNSVLKVLKLTMMVLRVIKKTWYSWVSLSDSSFLTFAVKNKVTSVRNSRNLCSDWPI